MSSKFIDVFKEDKNAIERQLSKGQKLHEYIVEELKKPERFSKIDPEYLTKYSAWIAEELKITSTQLRKFYTYVKGIEQDAKYKQKLDSKINSKLKFLLPKLAGSVQKNKQEGVKVLYYVFEACTKKEKIQDIEDLKLFVEFFEAILDYHSTIDQGKN